MTPSEQKKALHQYQGKVNKAMGATFEKLITGGCNYYRDQDIADIQKTPEPMQVERNLGRGKFIAHYETTAQADFKGFFNGGRAICFEAKYTVTGKMEQDRVTPEQTEMLERAYRYGAKAFVLCSFGPDGFYRIPWDIWRDMKGHFGHKYIRPQELADYKIRIGPRGALLFLDGIEEA